jgi:hypothetical protein
MELNCREYCEPVFTVYYTSPVCIICHKSNNIINNQNKKLIGLESTGVIHKCNATPPPPPLKVDNEMQC